MRAAQKVLVGSVAATLAALGSATPSGAVAARSARAGAGHAALSALITSARVTPGARRASALVAPWSVSATRAVAANRPVSVDVAFPLRHRVELEALTRAQATPGSTRYRHWLTPVQFRRRYGISTNELRRLAAGLRPAGLFVTRQGAQTVRVTGSAGAVERAFGTHLAQVRYTNGRSRLVSGTALRAPRAVTVRGGVPIDLSAAIRMTTGVRIAPHNRLGPYGGYWFDDLKQAYQYPVYGTPAGGGATGAGETIGVVMSSAPNLYDIFKYFAHEGMPAPDVTVDPIDGGSPFSVTSGASVEADLDVQQAAGMAPKAHVIVYDTPDLSDGSIVDAYVSAIEANQVDVLNSSFGGCELFYTAAYNAGTSYVGVLSAMDDLALQAASQGITDVASSGDFGSLGCTTPGYLTGATGARFIPGVQEPADSPNVTAVGGTNLVTTYRHGTNDSSYVGENATADALAPNDPYGYGDVASGGYWGSGGGFSRLFAEPAWQRADTTNATGQRALPDVALHMGGCPQGIALRCNPEDSYVAEYFGGRAVGVIGTSASAPDFAGTVALYDEVHGGRAGNINPLLYRLGAAQRAGTLGYDVFHEDIPGNSGTLTTAYTASRGTAVGYDEVIGNGTLIAKNLIFGTDTTPAAGQPRTPTNP